MGGKTDASIDDLKRKLQAEQRKALYHMRRSQELSEKLETTKLGTFYYARCLRYLDDGTGQHDEELAKIAGEMDATYGNLWQKEVYGEVYWPDGTHDHSYYHSYNDTKAEQRAERAPEVHVYISKM